MDEELLENPKSASTPVQQKKTQPRGHILAATYGKADVTE